MLALLARLADFLRFAWVSYGIAARHGTPPPERLAAPSKRPALERVLSDALGGAAGGVVLVHWGPYGSGKTFAARRAAERLRANGSLVVALNGHHMLWAERASLQAFVRAGVGIPPDRPEPLSAFFGLRPTTLIVDDMDVPLRHAEDRAECLRALVADSRETRRFNVLLLVTSWEWAAELRALGATLTAEAPRHGQRRRDRGRRGGRWHPGGARLLRRDRAPLRGARPPHRRGVATRHRGPAAAR